MNKITFKIGDRLELVQTKSAIGRKISDVKYASQILDFDNIRTAKISMPILEGRIVPLEVGDTYQICFFTSSGLYQCAGQIKKRYADKKMYVLDVFLMGELKKYQRRKFYRLDCMFPIKYRQISEVESLLLDRIYENRFSSDEEKQNCADAIEKLPKEWFEGTISDLSGGGMRFHCKEPLEKGTKIEVMLPLSFPSGVVPIKFIMNVIACVFFEGSKIAYEVRGEFERVKDSEREQVIKYVFEEQRRRMRKE